MWSVVVVWAGSLPPSFLHPGQAGGDSLMMRKMETGDKGNGENEDGGGGDGDDVGRHLGVVAASLGSPGA